MWFCQADIARGRTPRAMASGGMAVPIVSALVSGIIDDNAHREHGVNGAEGAGKATLGKNYFFLMPLILSRQ